MTTKYVLILVDTKRICVKFTKLNDNLFKFMLLSEEERKKIDPNFTENYGTGEVENLFNCDVGLNNYLKNKSNPRPEIILNKYAAKYYLYNSDDMGPEIILNKDAAKYYLDDMAPEIIVKLVCILVIIFCILIILCLSN